MDSLAFGRPRVYTDLRTIEPFETVFSARWELGQGIGRSHIGSVSYRQLPFHPFETREIAIEAEHRCPVLDSQRGKRSVLTSGRIIGCGDIGR